MLDPVEALLDSGFHRVVVLDGAECGLDAEQSLILALWCYEAEKQPASVSYTHLTLPTICSV